MNLDELKEHPGVVDDAGYRIHPDTGRVRRGRFFGWKGKA